MPFCTACGQPYTQPLKFCTACGAAIALIVDTPLVARPTVQPTVPAQPAPVPPTPSPASAIVEKWDTGKQAFHYKPLLLLLLVAGAAFAVYKFFFASNPKKDGAAAAGMACNCTEKRNAAWPTSYQAFITASASRAFISGEEIGACIDSLASAAQVEYDSCSGEATNFYGTVAKKYVDEKGNLFTEAYMKAMGECSSKGVDFNTLYNASRAEASRKLSGNIGRYQPPQRTEVTTQTAPPPEAIEKVENAPPVSANQSEMVQQFTRFFEAENSIASTADIENVLDYYSYPMRRNFKLTNVARERIQRMYKSWFLVTYPYHRRYNYQNHIKEIPLADGRTRLEVTFTFEISGNRDGTNSKIQTVSNAYIFNADGKIESVGLATDKNL